MFANTDDQLLRGFLNEKLNSEEPISIDSVDTFLNEYKSMREDNSKGYVILSFINTVNQNVWRRMEDNIFKLHHNHKSGSPESYFLRNEKFYTIESVKRLSDNQVFTINKENCCSGKSYLNPPYPNKKIKKFFFYDSILMCQFDEGYGNNNDGCVSIYAIEKSVEIPRPPQGVIPRYLWLEWRKNDLTEAIERYKSSDYKPLPEWIEEVHLIDIQLQEPRKKY